MHLIELVFRLTLRIWLELVWSEALTPTTICAQATDLCASGIGWRCRTISAAGSSNWKLGAGDCPEDARERAITQLHAAIEIDPNFPRAHNLMALCYTRLGRFEEAASEAQQAAELSGPRRQQPDAASRLSYQLAFIYAKAGRAADARRVVEELEPSASARNDQLYHHALASRALGDRDRAFVLIEELYETRNIDFATLKYDPEWDSLRDDPRFQALIRRSGLTR
jgi:tetratricopeptide (TPR) repeat protein